MAATENDVKHNMFSAVNWWWLWNGVVCAVEAVEKDVLV